MTFMNPENDGGDLLGENAIQQLLSETGNFKPCHTFHPLNFIGHFYFSVYLH